MLPGQGVERRHLQATRLAPGGPEIEQDDRPARVGERPVLAVEVGEVEAGHGPCRGPGPNDRGRGAPARQTADAAAALMARVDRATARDDRGNQGRRAHAEHCGRYRAKVRGPATRRSGERTRKSNDARSKTPRFLQTWLADSVAERAAACAALLGRSAEHRAEVLLRPPRLAPCSRRSPSCPSTTRRAPKRRSSPRMAPTWRARSARGMTLIDLGAGNCAKAASLFPLLEPKRYIAVDISVEFLRDALRRCSASIRSSRSPGSARTSRPRIDIPADLLAGDATGLLLSRLEHRQLHGRRGARLPAPASAPAPRAAAC